jgi:site-specific DNA-methyltransferase (adenine-specific)
LTVLLNKVTQGDCLEVSGRIESGSVDLILTDLPYGTMNGAGLDGWEHNKTSWDFAIEPEKIYEIANRALRKNGKMVLFSQEPYSTKLISKADANIPFSYRMIWEKDHFANALVAKKAPVSYYEDVLVFSKNHDTESLHPLRSYFSDVATFIGKRKKEIIETIGQRADHTFRTNSTQYGLCTEQTYSDLISEFHIDKMSGFKQYSELKFVDEQFKKDLPSTFNLWEGKKYKSNILKYKKDYDGFHPTQKPVLLLEDLIKTFSNEGDLVVDLTCGSGSTGVATINTNRQFIGIERETDYVAIANKRIQDAISAKGGK